MKESLVLIPEDFLKKLENNQDQILSILTKKGEVGLDFITEAEAKELFKRKSTWFWQMRKNGVLPYSKIGKAIYYSKKELATLIEDSKTKPN